MHVDDQRLARHLLGMDARRVGEPVMAVNDVAVHGAGNDTRNDAVVVDFFEQVLGITSREFYTSQVVGAHVVEVAVDVVAQVEVHLRVHHVTDAALNIVPVHVAPCHRCAVGTDDVGEFFGLIAPGLGDDKGDVHVAILPHALGESVTCGSQSSQDVRRKFPAEH